MLESPADRIKELKPEPARSRDRALRRLRRDRRLLVAALVAVATVAASLAIWRFAEPPAPKVVLPAVIDDVVAAVNQVAASGNPADALPLDAAYAPAAAIHAGGRVATGMDEIRDTALANAELGWSIRRTGGGVMSESYISVPMTWTCNLCARHEGAGVMVFEVVNGKIANQWWFGPVSLDAG